MSKIKNVFSAFNGISCGRIALERAGVEIENFYTSEIKEHAIQVADKNFQQDIENKLGDITKISYKKHFLNNVFYDKETKDIIKTLNGDIDLLIGGSPCQDFSAANKERLGVEGMKSKLFFEFVRLLREIKPKYFLLENVRMKKEHQDFVSNILGVEPIVINSELVSAQLRHRLYWTNIPINKMPTDKNINLNDILINGYSDRTKARTLLESDSRPLATPIKMAHRYFNTGFTTLIFKDEQHFKDIKKHFDEHFKGLSAAEINEKILNNNINLEVYEGIRYMTSKEREACQTVPQGFTSSLTENEAACVLGDGWTVDVLAHIFKGLR